MRVQRFKAHVHDDAVIGDLVSVPAAQEATAAKFWDQEVALRPPAVELITQLNDAIDHSVLGRLLAISAAGQEEHRAVGDRSLDLQVADEPFKVYFRGRHFLRRDKTVHYQQGDTAPLELAANQFAESAKPVL